MFAEIKEKVNEANLLVVYATAYTLGVAKLIGELEGLVAAGGIVNPDNCCNFMLQAIGVSWQDINEFLA